MPSKKKQQRSMLKKRLQTLEAELLTLDSRQPRYESTKRMLEQQYQLAKAQLQTPTQSKKRIRASGQNKSLPPVKNNNSKNTKSPVPKKSGKKSPLPGGASFPSFQLPSPKSPTFYEDSLKTVGSLRNLCRQCMGYIQRADQLFDSLHGVGSHLHESGVLPKIMSGKFKELNTGEWGALLMALMNSPLSGMLLGGGGNNEAESEHKEQVEHTEHHDAVHEEKQTAKHT